MVAGVLVLLSAIVYQADFWVLGTVFVTIALTSISVVTYQVILILDIVGVFMNLCEGLFLSARVQAQIREMQIEAFAKSVEHDLMWKHVGERFSDLCSETLLDEQLIESIVGAFETELTNVFIENPVFSINQLRLSRFIDGGGSFEETVSEQDQDAMSIQRARSAVRLFHSAFKTRRSERLPRLVPAALSNGAVALIQNPALTDVSILIMKRLMTSDTIMRCIIRIILALPNSVYSRFAQLMHEIY
ncbi:hypothetical protein NDN08_002686 [Rhodosorus marinus]|uniref:PXA domain-containing protein n=1 Tax=Rhodosorus marinus TaxID=101924 RepID=A0AAV8V074_9RHOD|nr:hypothetical protein NDN08_002686 [Rhodosorus marinus]